MSERPAPLEVDPEAAFGLRHHFSRADVWGAIGLGTLCGLCLLGLVHWWQAALAGALGAWLTLLAIVDIRHRLLPDLLTLPLCLLGLGLSFAGLGPEPASAAAGAAAGYIVIAGLAYAYRRRRGIDGIGMGDAKLLAALGAWVGPLLLPHLILLASLLGLAGYGLQTRGRRMDLHHITPFGPFLAVSGWAMYVLSLVNFDPSLWTASLFGRL